MNKVPKLRFPEFSGEWEEKKLGDRVKILSSGKTKERDKGGVYNLYGSTGIIGLTNECLYEGEYILIARVGANAGTVNKINEKCGVSDNTLTLKLKKDTSFSYSFYLLKKYNLNRLVFGSGQPLITGGDLKNLKLNFPSLPEQEKIASFLSSVDEKITILEKKKSLWEKYKKGMMQKIFSQEIRFKDDNGKDYPEWEEKMLGEVCEFKKGVSISKSDIDLTGKYPCVLYGELFTKYSELITSIISWTKKEIKCEGKIGDILMPTSDVTPNGLGKACCLQMNNVILGGDMNILRPNKYLHGNYFVYQLNFENKKIIERVSGTTIKHIYVKDIRDLCYFIPCLLEQNKISDFLSKLNLKIKQLEKELVTINEFKKGILQQMFV